MVMSVISYNCGRSGTSPENADRGRAMSYVSQVVPWVKHMSYASIEAAQNWDVSERYLIVVNQVLPQGRDATSRKETG